MLTLRSRSSGSLQAITAKLQLLLTMMHAPAPSADQPDAPTYTAFQRLKLLREVTEDARVFRLGGEDKIRVATGTCETVSRFADLPSSSGRSSER